MLARLDPGAARAALVPARRAHQGRGARARARRRPAGGRQAREPGPLLRRRPRRPRASCAATAAPRLRRPGEIVDRDGRVLGRHDGQHDFTVGQRRGLGVAAPEPLYVLDEGRRARNRVVGRPARRRSRPRACALEAPRLHRPPDAVGPVRLRYHARAAALPRAGEPAAGARARARASRPHAVGARAARVPDA